MAQWSTERTVVAREDPLLKHLGVSEPCAYSSGGRGEGRPDFGVMEPSRQREVALLVRCQVCASPLLPGRRYQPSQDHPVWLADLRARSTAPDVAYGGSAIRVGRRMRPLIFEPWVCADCLAYAIRVCPGLLSLSHESTVSPKRDLRLLRVRKAQPVAARALHPELGEIVTYVKLAAIDFNIVTPGDFLTSLPAVCEARQRSHPMEATSTSPAAEKPEPDPSGSHTLEAV